ncbi:hypothetical protein GF361_01105 [Candidatus Woesearchaeota archaeon]|nr:hypothetical protein [Candidatus Woesearchaeota archaeon]
MKKKTWLFLILILTVFLIMGCKKEQEPQTDQEIKTPEQTQESVEQEQGEEGKILNLLRCSDNRIEAELYNNREEPLVIGEDIKIIIRGLIVPIPDCDNTTIKPGETVYCSDITGKYKIKDGINRVQANLLRERAIEDIDCSLS